MLYGLSARLARAGGLVLLLSVAGVPLVEAAPKKSDSKAGGKKGKKSKAGRGSMDESAGEPDGELAPGSDDARARGRSRKKPEEPPPEPEPAPEPAPALEASSDIQVVDETAPPPEPEPEPEPSGIKKNWVSLGVQQDLLFYPAVSGVCEATSERGTEFPGSPQYSCRDGSGLYDGNVYAGAGNQIQSGIGLATIRVLAGYDRVFIERLTIGGRIGYAFGGAPTVPGGGAFIPWHVELKSMFYFGNAPFERNGVRPFASLGVGLGEIDGLVSVDFYVNKAGFDAGERGRLDVWRKTGTAFAAAGLGVAYPVGPVMPFLEGRAIMMLGESAFAMGLSGGIAYGI